MKKPASQKARKVSISMPQILFDDAEIIRQQLRLATFSDYIQSLVRGDIEAQRPRRIAA